MLGLVSVVVVYNKKKKKEGRDVWIPPTIIDDLQRIRTTSREFTSPLEAIEV